MSRILELLSMEHSAAGVFVMAVMGHDTTGFGWTN
jgi:hypothetical protein